MWLFDLHFKSGRATVRPGRLEFLFWLHPPLSFLLKREGDVKTRKDKIQAAQPPAGWLLPACQPSTRPSGATEEVKEVRRARFVMGVV